MIYTLITGYLNQQRVLQGQLLTAIISSNHFIFEHYLYSYYLLISLYQRTSLL